MAIHVLRLWERNWTTHGNMPLVTTWRNSWERFNRGWVFLRNAEYAVESGHHCKYHFIFSPHPVVYRYQERASAHHHIISRVRPSKQQMMQKYEQLGPEYRYLILQQINTEMLSHHPVPGVWVFIYRVLRKAGKGERLTEPTRRIQAHISPEFIHWDTITYYKIKFNSWSRSAEKARRSKNASRIENQEMHTKGNAGRVEMEEEVMKRRGLAT